MYLYIYIYSDKNLLSQASRRSQIPDNSTHPCCSSSGPNFHFSLQKICYAEKLKPCVHVLWTFTVFKARVLYVCSPFFTVQGNQTSSCTCYLNTPSLSYISYSLIILYFKNYFLLGPARWLSEGEGHLLTNLTTWAQFMASHHERRK